MAAASLFQYWNWAFISGPKEDRALLRTIKRNRCVKIVELGMADTLRADRLIRVAQRYSPDLDVHYTACDLFDARSPSEEPIKLIDAHRDLRNSGAKINLLPGSAEQVLPRTANALTGTDLLIVSADHLEGMSRGWYYVPRMLSEKAAILREVETPSGEIRYVKLSRSWINQQADNISPNKKQRPAA